MAVGIARHDLGDGWVHEIIFDGYRVRVHKAGCNRHDFTDRFPSIARLLRELPCKGCSARWRTGTALADTGLQGGMNRNSDTARRSC